MERNDISKQAKDTNFKVLAMLLDKDKAETEENIVSFSGGII